MNAKLRDQLQAVFNGGLLELGFEKRKGLLFKRFATGAVIRVGLNAKHFRDGSVMCLVIVGVRFDSVYQEGLRLGAYAESDGNLSLSSALGYLSNHGDGGSYFFEPETDSDSVARALLLELERFGLPAVEKLASVPAALEAVVNDPTTWRNVETFVPLAYWCLGYRGRAADEAERFARTMDLTRGEGRRFNAFVAAMRQEVDSPL